MSGEKVTGFSSLSPLPPGCHHPAGAGLATGVLCPWLVLQDQDQVLKLVVIMEVIPLSGSFLSPT